MRRIFLLVVVLALAAIVLSATIVVAQEGRGKSIYATARWSDYYKRIEAAGFELGCDLYLLPSTHNDLSATDSESWLITATCSQGRSPTRGRRSPPCGMGLR